MKDFTRNEIEEIISNPNMLIELDKDSRNELIKVLEKYNKKLADKINKNYDTLVQKADLFLSYQEALFKLRLEKQEEEINKKYDNLMNKLKSF